MSRSKPARAEGVAPDPVWREEWIEPATIVKHLPLQVRRKLDSAAVRRYYAMTQAGSVPPPIKVGRVGELVYLVDGWHRMEADALVHSDVYDGGTIKVLVADLDEAGVRWEAAKANMGHGVPLKASEHRSVLGAFIKARRHRRPDGSFLGYRDIGAVLGKGHTTIRNWTQKDFPGVFRAMGGGRVNGNDSAQQPASEPYPITEELRDQAMLAMTSIKSSMAGLTPQDRWRLVQQLDAARRAAVDIGIVEPEPDPF